MANAETVPENGQRWTLTPVTAAERPLLRQLTEFYLYDFTDYAPWDVHEDGRFIYHPLELYWTEPGRHALLVRVEGKPAGFVLVMERSPLPNGGDRHYVAEFFVMRKYRRRGIGAAVARTVFDRFPGGWQVLQMPENTAAQAFWRRVIGSYTGGRYAKHRTDEGDIVQEFDTRDRRGQ